jgi:hypothetical protein
MTELYSASAYFHPTDGSGYARARGLRVFKERLEKPGTIYDPPVTEWTCKVHGPTVDWPAAGVRLFSARMAEIVQAHLSGLDSVQWLPAVVIGGDGHRSDYRIPHFVERPDVLDFDASTWGPNGEPIRWVLSSTKAAGRNFFPSHSYARNVIISSALHDAFRRAELTGLDIDRARVAG